MIDPGLIAAGKAAQARILAEGSVNAVVRMTNPYDEEEAQRLLRNHSGEPSIAALFAAGCMLIFVGLRIKRRAVR